MRNWRQILAWHNETLRDLYPSIAKMTHVVEVNIGGNNHDIPESIAAKAVEDHRLFLSDRDWMKKYWGIITGHVHTPPDQEFTDAYGYGFDENGHYNDVFRLEEYYGFVFKDSGVVGIVFDVSGDDSRGDFVMTDSSPEAEKFEEVWNQSPFLGPDIDTIYQEISNR